MRWPVGCEGTQLESESLSNAKIFMISMLQLNHSKINVGNCSHFFLIVLF